MATPESEKTALGDQPKPAEAKDLPIESIGWLFIQRYYSVYTSDMQRLSELYDKDAVVYHEAFGDQDTAGEVRGVKTAHVACGLDAITQFFNQAQSTEINKVVIESAEFQSSAGGSILIMVAGTWKRGVSPMKHFVQTFILTSKKHTVYDVSNDILKYLELTEEDVRTTVVAVEAEKASAQEPAQEPAQESAQETAQESAQESTQDSAQESTQDSAQESAQDSAQESAQESAQDSAQTSSQTSAQASVQESAQTSSQTSAQASAGSSGAPGSAPVSSSGAASTDKIPQEKATVAQKPEEEKKEQVQATGTQSAAGEVQSKAASKSESESHQPQAEKEAAPVQKPTWATLAAIEPKPSPRSAAISTPAANGGVGAVGTKTAPVPKKFVPPPQVGQPIRYRKEEWYPIYIKNIDVEEEELKSALIKQFGDIKYFKKSSRTALCDFRFKEDQLKALEAKEITVRNNRILLEQRVHKAYNGKPDAKKDKKLLKKPMVKKA